MRSRVENNSGLDVPKVQEIEQIVQSFEQDAANFPRPIDVAPYLSAGPFDFLRTSEVAFHVRL